MTDLRAGINEAKSRARARSEAEGCCAACDAGLPCEASSEPSAGTTVPAESATKATKEET